MDHLQISFLVLSEFKLIHLFLPWNYQKTYVILMISGRIKAKLQAKYQQILKS